MEKKLKYDFLVRPVVSEKSVKEMEKGKYCFEVLKEVNKLQIKEAVEKLFKVKVKRVNIIKVPGKTRFFRGVRGKTRNWKKAIVTLKPGDKIEIFEGM
jgi:large subunit ribosomal protein L23